MKALKDPVRARGSGKHAASAGPAAHAATDTVSVDHHMQPFNVLLAQRVLQGQLASVLQPVVAQVAHLLYAFERQPLFEWGEDRELRF
ncbi:MAG: hypothetical protein KVP17_000157 [Porospora cf. gigantea B]|uniref:uncharacterized protein n=1 Tax=Porospora cf. gigantea B TaxID=2853592 RepID=UPI003571EB25|nr:MAG: hypothetical protein KVP17_000157 [Porospora cf. gigantea B]